MPVVYLNEWQVHLAMSESDLLIVIQSDKDGSILLKISELQFRVGCC